MTAIPQPKTSTCEVTLDGIKSSHQPVLHEDCGVQARQMEAQCHSKCDWNPVDIVMPTGEPQTQVNTDCYSPAEHINLWNQTHS